MGTPAKAVRPGQTTIFLKVNMPEQKQKPSLAKLPVGRWLSQSGTQVVITPSKLLAPPPQHLGLFVQSSKKPSFEPPAHPAGALHDPKFQVNRKKNCMLSTHNTFNTVGITPQMMGVPVDLQAGGPQPPKPPVSNSEFLAGAPT